MSRTTEMVEQDLRDVFAADAGLAPAVGHLAGAVRGRVRRQRVTLGGLGLAVAAAVGGGLAVGPLADTGRDDVPSAEAPERHGALAGDDGVECVEAYTPIAVATRAFAFDGTVTAIGPGTTDRPGAELVYADLGYAAVTFDVHEWFAGGSGDTVTVDMQAPIVSAPGVDPGSELAFSYGLATRLLVSGEPRWGGEPMEQAIAWTCGFTRYHDEVTAAEWRAAVAGG